MMKDDQFHSMQLWINLYSMSKKQKNVLGGDLELCSSNPLTGWFRDGCCNTDDNDNGLHTVCA